jgi:hypothetical protein
MLNYDAGKDACSTGVYGATTMLAGNNNYYPDLIDVGSTGAYGNADLTALGTVAARNYVGSIGASENDLLPACSAYAGNNAASSTGDAAG